MTGTLGGALEARGIPSQPNKLTAEARGDVVKEDGVLVIARIHVRYEIEVPAGKRGDAERALEKHVENCPVARTLTPCVEIDWEAEITEV
ncbi:MAG: OsmC family protein [Gemmatimonadota bacterium]